MMNWGNILPNKNWWRFCLGIILGHFYIGSGNSCRYWVVFHYWSVKAKLCVWLPIIIIFYNKNVGIFLAFTFGALWLFITLKSHGVLSNLWSLMSVYLFLVSLTHSMYTVQTSVHMLLIRACVHASLLAKCAIWPKPCATMQGVYYKCMFTGHGSKWSTPKGCVDVLFTLW